ncbi:transposase [Paenibacillus daejeonensis]|uniref:transposase n=1 Tax=Paenibacillus daejeonensis TaxID=135193 RepID=UPI000376D499|nr:transposase [Paenibacillus daejeonensis]
MAQTRYKQLNQISFADLEVYSVLPEHPIWSRAAEVLDFSFADEICAPLYASRGPKPYAPSLKLKLHLVQRYYNLSDRAMEERVIGDLFIKRFLGLPVSFIGFDHSTIALDRERMGSDLFDACHHHILAQAKQKGLWGGEKDVWLIDSFHTDGRVPRRSSFRLIKQAVLRVMNHLKRAHPPLYRQLNLDLKLDVLSDKLPATATPEDVAALYSQLVVFAYGLLHWFEKPAIRKLFWSWEKQDRQLESLVRQGILFRILNENTMPEDPEDPERPYEKRPRSKRPTDRLLSSVDPDARVAKKRGKTYFGDKTQVLMSTEHDMVLLAEPFPCNEHDGQSLPEIVEAVWYIHRVTPEAVVGDSAYGYGRHRRSFANGSMKLVAPLQAVHDNPKGLFSNKRFTYDSEAQTMTCPAGIVTSKHHDNRHLKGTQFTFPKQACMTCTLRESCTTSASGRSIFISDYYEEFQAAEAFNETDEGKHLLKQRNAVERKINEMKNAQGLGQARTCSRERRRRDVKLVCMVVNLKQFIKQATNKLTLGFVRKRPLRLSAPFSGKLA